MGDKTKIAWTDRTWNPMSGCTKVSEGCDNQRTTSSVAFSFKRWGAWAPVDSLAVGDNTRTGSADDWVRMGKVGAKAAGRVLDGVVWDEFPEPLAVDGSVT